MITFLKPLKGQLWQCTWDCMVSPTIDAMTDFKLEKNDYIIATGDDIVIKGFYRLHVFFAPKMQSRVYVGRNQLKGFFIPVPE